MLTEQQEKYCVNIVSGMSQTAAYKDAYDAKDMKIESIYVEASKLMDNPKFTLRIEVLSKEARSDRIINTIQKKELLTQWIYDDSKKEDSRLKAMDILNKMDGEYVTRLEGNIDVTYEESLKELIDTDEY